MTCNNRCVGRVVVDTDRDEVDESCALPKFVLHVIVVFSPNLVSSYY